MHEKVLKSIMGEELYESLRKSLVKLGTKSVVDLSELHSAVKTVPKSIIAFLMGKLKDLEKDETKEIDLPWEENSKMTVTKRDADVYQGKIVRDSKVVHEFQLTAIPQLAAHLMSTFELYDDMGSNNDDLSEKLKSLEEKINSLMMLVVAQGGLSKSEGKKINSLEFLRHVKSLKKGGLAPKMPSPPEPGTKVGGNQGITQAGFHGDKTEHSDVQTKPITQLKNPYLKPAQPHDMMKPEKTITVKKSDLYNLCEDCNQTAAYCSCYRAFSMPEIKKSEETKVTLKFGGDWDEEAVKSLHLSIIRGKKQ